MDADSEYYNIYCKEPVAKVTIYTSILYFVIVIYESMADVFLTIDGVFHGYDELDNERIDLDFCWVPLEDLKKGTKVYPLELIPYILEPGKEIVHFVSKQI